MSQRYEGQLNNNGGESRGRGRGRGHHSSVGVGDGLSSGIRYGGGRGRSINSSGGPHSSFGAAGTMSNSGDPSPSRGRGRGSDNRPAWMTRGGGGNDNHSGPAKPQPPPMDDHGGRAGGHSQRVASTSSQPSGVISNTARGRGRGSDNRPAWMTQQQPQPPHRLESSRRGGNSYTSGGGGGGDRAGSGGGSSSNHHHGSRSSNSNQAPDSNKRFSSHNNNGRNDTTRNPTRRSQYDQQQYSGQRNRYNDNDSIQRNRPSSYNDQRQRQTSSQSRSKPGDILLRTSSNEPQPSVPYDAELTESFISLQKKQQQQEEDDLLLLSQQQQPEKDNDEDTDGSSLWHFNGMEQKEEKDANAARNRRKQRLQRLSKQENNGDLVSAVESSALVTASEMPSGSAAKKQKLMNTADLKVESEYASKMDVDKPRNPSGVIKSEMIGSSQTNMETNLAAPEQITSGVSDSAVDDNADNDIYNDDDDDDMFNMSTATPSPTTTRNKRMKGKMSDMRGDKNNPSSASKNTAVVNEHDSGNYDDSDGYYKASIGEMIPLPADAVNSNTNSSPSVAAGNSIKVLGIIGKGVFSTVLKCTLVKATTSNDTNATADTVTIAAKLIRSNDVMARAAQKELRILRLLCRQNNIASTNHQSMAAATTNSATTDSANQPEDGGAQQQTAAAITTPNNFIVEMLPNSGFDYRHHTTLLFEYMPLNLRETLHKFGRGVGITLSAVKSYARQLLTALVHLSMHNIVHADIKPDNILVSENYAVVKLCDFGSAFFENDVDNDPTPYLVSRFYRPPEVILGLEYDAAVDLWSIACTLTELFTGNVLFPGQTNNAMLTLFMETMGPFSNKMVRRHLLSYERLQLPPHFTEGRGCDYRFKKQEVDRVTGNPVLRIVPITLENSGKSGKSISHLLLKSRSENDERSEVLKFADLLNRCLALDPGRRMKVEETLKQDFIVSSSNSNGKRGKVMSG